MRGFKSLDYNDGYLQCLNDLIVFSSAKLSGIDYKKMRDEFVMPRIDTHNKNIGHILDALYNDYKKQNPNQKG